MLHAMDTLPAAGMLVADHSSALGGGAGPSSAAAGCSSKQAHHHGREHGHEGQQSGQQVACQNYGAAGCSSGPPTHACDEQMAECAVMSRCVARHAVWVYNIFYTGCMLSGLAGQQSSCMPLSNCKADACLHMRLCISPHISYISACCLLSAPRSRIQAAIDTWQSLTCGAHTPSTCIPPPG